jgi:hypothetical protein
MKIIATAIILLSLSGVVSAVNFTNPYFHIDLPGDWTQQEGSDPEQFVFTSASRNGQITMSSVPMNTKGQDLERIANKLLEIRFAAEHESSTDREVFTSEPWGTKLEDGALQVNYMGRDSLGRHFFYTGFVTEAHITNVTGELMNGNEPALHAFYQEVLGGLRY